MATNTTTSETIKPEVTGAELFTDEALGYISDVFRFVFSPGLSALGIIANIINAIVFYKMGLSDGMTQNFFILSLSDGTLAWVSVVLCYSYISETILRNQSGFSGSSPLDAQTVFWVTCYVALFPQSVSIITTVVIAIVRCCCVAMPLKFKAVVTARRQLAAIIVPSSACLGVLIYSCHSIQVHYVSDPVTNSTFPLLVGADWLTLTMTHGVLSFSAFITVAVCVVILTNSLLESAAFRNRSSAAHFNSLPTQSGPSTRCSTHSTTVTTGSDLHPDVIVKRRERGKEIRVVKTVVLVSTVFIVCTIPSIVYIILHQFVPGFAPQGRYRNENIFMLMLSELMNLFNITMNIVVYYASNNKYRVTFQAIFRRE